MFFFPKLTVTWLTFGTCKHVSLLNCVLFTDAMMKGSSYNKKKYKTLKTSMYMCVYY